MAGGFARLPPQSLLRLTHFWRVPAASSGRGSRRAVLIPWLVLKSSPVGTSPSKMGTLTPRNLAERLFWTVGVPFLGRVGPPLRYEGLDVDLKPGGF